MILFNSDYLEGAHERILERMAETNRMQTAGYGDDPICAHARELICREVGDADAYVQFLVGGTQTNTTVLASLMRPHEGVIAASTGHIACHESGAIEATGHKVIALPEHDGKLDAKEVEAYLAGYFADETKEHIVKPRVVFVAFSTEEGTLYTKAELRELHAVCRKYGLLLYLDGARLGYGLMSDACDMKLSDIYENTDVFYIGGTKVGALFGEAVVFRPETPHDDFKYLIKQHGGLLAKGRLLGIQFEVLFEDSGDACLYYELARRADALAMKLRDGIRALGYSFYRESPTNQQFPILPDVVLETLSRSYSYGYWARVSETESAVRFCTSWATREADVDALLADLSALTTAK